MENLIANYQEARAALQLDSYDAWLVECVARLLQRHNERVARWRKSETMLAAQKTGRRVSSIPPYGWAFDSNRPWRLTPQPEEQKVVAMILHEVATGKSLRAIARGLDAAGISCRLGRSWSHQTIGAIVRRSRCEGGKMRGFCDKATIDTTFGGRKGCF